MKNMNWTRQEVKAKAKAAMSASYWKMFVASILLTAVAGGTPYIIEAVFSPTPMPIDVDYDTVTNVILGASVFAGVLELLWLFLVAAPLEIGVTKYYIQASEDSNAAMDRCFDGFRYNWKNVVWIYLLMVMKLFLWSLLFVVPGIIKAFEYSMIPYLLAENPNMTAKEAFETSKKMTDNEKWNLFVLDLSFVGWYLLGLLCCGIGTIFVAPYVRATEVQAYFVLKTKLIPNIPDEQVISE